MKHLYTIGLAAALSVGHVASAGARQEIVLPILTNLACAAPCPEAFVMKGKLMARGSTARGAKGSGVQAQAREGDGPPRAASREFFAGVGRHGAFLRRRPV